MKLSVLPLSMRPPTSNPCMSILHIALDSADGPVTDAIVGRFVQADVETVENGSERHTFAKCPFLWHLLHVASRAGHFERYVTSSVTTEETFTVSSGRAESTIWRIHAKYRFVFTGTGTKRWHRWSHVQLRILLCQI